MKTKLELFAQILQAPGPLTTRQLREIEEIENMPETNITITMEYMKETKNMVVYKHDDQPEFRPGVYFMKNWVPKQADGNYPKTLEVTFALPNGRS